MKAQPPSTRALLAAQSFADGYDHQGRERQQCTAGLCVHLRSKNVCSWEIDALARFLDDFAAKEKSR